MFLSVFRFFPPHPPRVIGLASSHSIMSTETELFWVKTDRQGFILGISFTQLQQLPLKLFFLHLVLDLTEVSH